MIVDVVKNAIETQPIGTLGWIDGSYFADVTNVEEKLKGGAAGEEIF